MKLTLDRKYKLRGYTIGKLYINGKFFADTMEDEDRGLTQDMPLDIISKKKIYGKTAIPRGKYEIELTYSNKFATRKWGRRYKGLVPLIKNVKAFEGVRIHPLNTAEDSLGCIGVGENKIKGQIINSTKYYYKLMDDYILPATRKGDAITLEIY